jgi:hypothetical protein
LVVAIGVGAVGVDSAARGQTPPRAGGTPPSRAATATPTTRRYVLTEAEREQYRAEVNRPGITVDERKQIIAKWREVQEKRLGPRPEGAELPWARKAPSTGPVVYGAATRGEIFRALNWAQTYRDDAKFSLGITLREIETPHFTIYTDWPASQDGFLRQRFEESYLAVARFFERTPQETVFVGKLPAYVFQKKADFVKFADHMDEMDASNNGGYYFSDKSNGLGHLVLYDPRREGDAQRLRWSYVVTHELTHGFVHRHRTNVRVPKWLNEGMAEVVASRQYPGGQSGSSDALKKTAAEIPSLAELFEAEKGFLDRKYYPVCRGMVELLINRDRAAFWPFVGAVKDGTEPEEALRTHYKMGYAELEAAWRLSVKNN